MKIRFEVTIEDLVAFTVYYCDNSPTVRRTKMMYLWGAPIFVLVCTLAIFFVLVPPEELGDEGVALAILFSLTFTMVFTTIWVLRWPEQYRKAITRRARKLYTEGSAAGSVGNHELELTETDLVERTPIREIRTRLSAIEKVVTNEDCTYIFFNSFTAYVIPQDAVTAGDLTAFIESLERRISVDRA